MLEKLFKIKERGSTYWREILGGIVTFMTMSYIIFVNPTILSDAGMDFHGAMVATCLAAALATLTMGLLANMPVALAPGMGINAYFAYTVVLTMGIGWRAALAAVFVSGILFFILTLFKVQHLIIGALPRSIKKAIAAGIGLFIAFVGLQNMGIIQFSQNTFVEMGHLTSPPVLLAIFGLAITALMIVWKVRGAILWGIMGTAIVGLAVGILQWQGIIDLQPRATLFLQLDFRGMLDLGFLNIIFIFLFVDMFDTVGTLVAVTDEAGLVDKKGKIPRVGRALASDAIGTIFGALFGTSTTTSYIESASGVASGARTGLANVVTAMLFLLALLFTPLVKTIAAGIPVEQVTPILGAVGGEQIAGLFTSTALLHPVTGPALLIVGSMMMMGLRDIAWKDPVEGIPAFLTLIAIPLTFSIGNGIMLGFISYPILMAVTGRWKEVHWLAYILAILFVVRFIFFMF